MWTEVSSSVPHFLHMGSLHSPMICKYPLKLLCPVSRPITTLVCVLLKDSSRAPIARSGPTINCRACLCVLQGPHHNARCLFSIQRFIFLLIFCLETPRQAQAQQTAEPSLRAHWRFYLSQREPNLVNRVDVPTIHSTDPLIFPLPKHFCRQVHCPDER